MVASCITGKIDNGIGSCGIAPNARCISVRWCTPVLFPGQTEVVLMGLDSDIVTGLRLAAEAGARISVHSYGFPWVSQGMEEAFAATREQGMIHFAATGNDAEDAGFDAKPSIHYPASSPFVLGVGAATSSLTRAAFSQFGSANQRTGNGVDFMAPGQSVAVMGRTGMPGVSDTRIRENGGSGTSFAAPYAAGVAALMLSVKPSLTPQQIEDLMIAGCFDLAGAGWDRRTGFGLVDAFASLPDDHGNTTAAATNVNATSITSGHLNRTSDADVFKFTVSDFCRIKIHTTGQVRTDLQIRNIATGGGGFNSRNTAASAFPGWTTGNFRTDIALEPGTYTARVSGLESSTGIYQLHLAIEAGFPEITVIGNTRDITDGDTTPDLADHTSFGTVRLGASVSRTFTIRNTGDSILRITNSTNLDDSRVSSSINVNVNAGSELNQAHGGVSNPVQNAMGNDPHALPDPNAPRFIDNQLAEIQNRAIKVSQAPSFQVLPGRSTSVTVKFTTSKTGNHTQKLTIQSNDADEAAFDFVVGGSALGLSATLSR